MSPYADDLTNAAAPPLLCPLPRRGWPVGPGDGLLFVRQKLSREALF